MGLAYDMFYLNSTCFKLNLSNIATIFASFISFFETSNVEKIKSKTCSFI